MKTVNEAMLTRIKDLLKENDMTLYRLSMNSGVDYSTLKNILHNTVKDNMLSTAILIAGGFNLKVSQFLNSPLFEEENLFI